MPLPFSFLAQRRTGPAAPVVESSMVAETVEPMVEEHFSSLPIEDKREPEESFSTPKNSMPLERPITTGLAAMVVNQTEAFPTPPAQRRLPGYITPGPAIAASLALATQMTPAPAPSHAQESITAPSINHLTMAGNLTSREIAELRVECQQEIEQLRNDLFGAAMGVSALKDRLDGLEVQVSQPPVIAAPQPPPISKQEVHTWMQEWVETRLDAVIEAKLNQALEQMMSRMTATLASHDFFRLPVRPAGTDASAVFSTAPTILASSES